MAMPKTFSRTESYVEKFESLKAQIDHCVNFNGEGEFLEAVDRAANLKEIYAAIGVVLPSSYNHKTALCGAAVILLDASYHDCKREIGAKPGTGDTMRHFFNMHITLIMQELDGFDDSNAAFISVYLDMARYFLGMHDYPKLMQPLRDATMLAVQQQPFMLQVMAANAIRLWEGF